MARHAVLLVLLLCYHLLFIGRVQCSRSPSKEDDLDRETGLKPLNKPSITIQDKYGDIHDCVDVYKQIAFDHPLLQNHTIDFQVISNQIYHKESRRRFPKMRKSFDPYSKSENCPIGTIPIRRISKADLSGERQNSKAKKTETINRPNAYLAVAQTKAGSGKYSGVGGYLKIDNPKVVGQQFSTTRIKVQAGSDSIEAGWRVDPSLYGDSRTRLFIRTDAGHTHCFNTFCPGFIHTFHGMDLDAFFELISKPGGKIYGTNYYIIRDNATGNWNFLIGKNSTVMGYWPSHIFTGLAGLADRVEWGGVAYSPPGTPLPPMGLGNHPIGDPQWDGTIAQMKILNERGQTFDASNLETFADNSDLYSVRDEGNQGKVWGHVIFYGGSGHNYV